MSVTGEIQVTIGTESREEFITRGVDRSSHILHASDIIVDAHTPDVFAAHATRHVTDKVEPVAIRTDGRMGEE